MVSPDEFGLRWDYALDYSEAGFRTDGTNAGL